MAFRCGTVAVIGKPNVGKSTLINHLIGEKVFITSPRPQTTRDTFAAILNDKNSQIVLYDTPGIHHPKTKFGKLLVQNALKMLDECDVILFVVDVSKMPNVEDKQIAKHLKQANKKTVVALNKMDRLRPEFVQMHYEAYEKLVNNPHMMYTNALTGENIEKLKQLIISALPESDPLYPIDDYITTQSLRQMVSEIIREKALLLTREEIPHSISVRLDSWEEDSLDDGSPITKIQTTIFVERESQKPIMIGKQGRMLKTIGTQARREIEELVGQKTYLGLTVKVREKWRDTPSKWKEMGISH